MRRWLAEGRRVNHRRVVVVPTEGKPEDAELEAALADLLASYQQVHETTVLPEVLWVSEKHKQKPRLFPDATMAGYVKSAVVLGQTFDWAVLRSAPEALTPNSLCHLVETIRGGGLLVLEVSKRYTGTLCEGKEMPVIQLIAERKYNSPVCGPVQGSTLAARLLGRLQGDALRIYSHPSAEQTPHAMQAQTEVPRCFAPAADAGPVAKLCANQDQADCFMKLCAWWRKSTEPFKTARQKKNGSMPVGVVPKLQVCVITAARGRGKSSLLGLLMAIAATKEYCITLLAPEFSAVKSLLTFAQRGSEAISQSFEQQRLGLEFGARNYTALIGDRCQLVFAKATDTPHTRGGLLVIDETAAIPLPVVKQWLSHFSRVMMASTQHGYEGSGRSLSLKLLKDFRAGGAALTDFELSEPIRYAAGDPVESWLNREFFLNSVCALVAAPLPPPEKCRLYDVDRRMILRDKKYDAWFGQLMSLFVESHYRNTPNDMMMLGDAPAHRVFVLGAPQTETAGELPVPLVAIQAAVEGGLDVSVTDIAGRGTSASGDMMAWKMAEQYRDHNLARKLGLRVVRIATHPQLFGHGYGSRAVQLLSEWARVQPRMPAPEGEVATQLKAGQALLESYPLQRPIDYLGTAFGLEAQLFRFWHKAAGLLPVYLAHTANETTAEHTVIMVAAFSSSSGSDPWHEQLNRNFTSRFLSLLTDPFRLMNSSLAAQIVHVCQWDLRRCALPIHWGNDEFGRIHAYATRQADRSLIRDLGSEVARACLCGQFGAKGKISRVQLSPLEATVMIGLALQHKTVDELASELDTQPTQLLGIYEKIIARCDEYFAAIWHGDIKKSRPEDDEFQRLPSPTNTKRIKLGATPPTVVIQKSRAAFKNI